MKRVFIYSLAALMLIGCGKKTTTTTVEEERVEQVRTTVLHYQEIQREISLSTSNG